MSEKVLVDEDFKLHHVTQQEDNYLAPEIEDMKQLDEDAKKVHYLHLQLPWVFYECERTPIAERVQDGVRVAQRGHPDRPPSRSVLRPLSGVHGRKVADELVELVQLIEQNAVETLPTSRVSVIVMTLYAGNSITAGAHRMWCHKAYKVL